MLYNIARKTKVIKMSNLTEEEQVVTDEVQIREVFISRILDLKLQIQNRYNTLNLEALWLFVATLGCWSVNHYIAQLAALIIVPFLFFYRVYEGKKTSTTFDKLLKEIRKDIEKSILRGDARLARFRELDEVQNDLRLKSLYQRAPNFLVAYVFYATTLFINLKETLNIIF